MTFSKLVRRLKEEMPLGVSVRRVKLSTKLCGDCQRVDGGYRIRVSRDLTHQLQLDTLVHEYAHAIAWDEYEQTGEHGAQWGAAFAECYRIYERVCCGK